MKRRKKWTLIHKYQIRTNTTTKLQADLTQKDTHQRIMGNAHEYESYDTLTVSGIGERWLIRQRLTRVVQDENEPKWNNKWTR